MTGFAVPHKECSRILSRSVIRGPRAVEGWQVASAVLLPSTGNVSLATLQQMTKKRSGR
jgi:hypothetical protein